MGCEREGRMVTEVEENVTEMCDFFFNDTATTEIYTLSLHDALPISDNRWKYFFNLTDYTVKMQQKR